MKDNTAFKNLLSSLSESSNPSRILFTSKRPIFRSFFCYNKVKHTSGGYDMKVFGINTCSTYKKAVKWFKDNDLKIETVNLRENAPSKADIERYHKLSGLELKKFLNTSGNLYRELDLKNRQKEMANDEIYQLLADNPMLIKRPLIVDGDYVRTGYKESEYISKWL